MLTINYFQDYSDLALAKSGVGIGLLCKAAKSRNDSSNAVFLRLAPPFMGGLGEEPQGSPVRFPGSPTRLVPPTRLDSGGWINQLNESEVIMTTKTKVTSSTRKKSNPKSNPKSNVLPLSPDRIKESKQRAWERELYDFLEPLSEPEFELARKLVDIISKRPSRKKQPCEVIQFVKGVQS